MNVTDEKSTPSNQTIAPTAPSTKRSKPLIKKKRKLSKNQRHWDYIVRKFVQRDKIVWPRDLAVVRGLMKTYPEFLFWYALPAPFQMNAMQGFLTEKAQGFLKLEYAKFNLQLPVPDPIILTPDLPCDRPTFAPRKPQSIMDFCR